MRLALVSVLVAGCYAVADEEVNHHQHERHVGKQRVMTDRHSHTSRRLGKTTGKKKEYDDEGIMSPYSAGKKKKNRKHKNKTNRNGGGKGNKQLRFGVPSDSNAEKTSDTSEGGDSKSDKMAIEGGDTKADKMINYSDLVDDADESGKAGKLSEEGSAKAGKKQENC